ncbi:MAG: L,D-transpeptidase family protein [Planctomycetota bacterium]|nr:L,D-transpeptidase family protein [Planctomycetota bacterium]
MGVWKDDKKAAEALSGNVEFPRTRYKLYGLLMLAVALAVCGAFVLLRGAPKNLAAAAREVPVADAVPAEQPAAPAKPVAHEAGVPAPPPQTDIIIMPPVVLGAASGSVGQSAAPQNGAPADARAALEEARRVEESASGDVAALERARKLYQQALDTGRLEEKDDAQCLARLVDLTNRIVLDPKTPCSAPAAVFHKVDVGDGVEKIARKYKVNQGQIKRINRLNDKLIVRLGQTVKMLPGDVVYKVDRTRLTGTLYIDGVFIRRYPVGIGPGNATPPGSYAVANKVVNPDWHVDEKRIPFGDPANILGTRWMGLDPFACVQAGLGIHGTSLPDSVPGRASKGCVRMLNKDVEELYDLMPQGGTVRIAD